MIVLTVDVKPVLAQLLKFQDEKDFVGLSSLGGVMS
jgi:hypothetical protein